MTQKLGLRNTLYIMSRSLRDQQNYALCLKMLAKMIIFFYKFMTYVNFVIVLFF